MANTAAHGIRPNETAPDLDLPLVGGGRFVLADVVADRFTMVIFNRGLHCPVCRAQLKELDRRMREFNERGIEVVSVSGETEARATRMRDEWRISDAVPLAYGLSEEQMRGWGLFMSRGLDDDEPPLFNEPALFLIARDQTVYYESLLSMPIGRPRLDELLSGIDYWEANDYPARGGA